MKQQLLLSSLLLALAGPALAQAGGPQALGFPVDSASQRVTYAAVVQVPGVSADALFSRAKAYAVGGVAAPLVDEAGKSVVGVWEKPVTSGSGLSRMTRTLRYQARITARDGRYRYELTDFQNKVASVQYPNPATHLVMTAPGGQSPIERLLANPDGYRKGKPTAALTAYVQAAQAAAGKGVADLQRGMAGAGTGGNW